MCSHEPSNHRIPFHGAEELRRLHSSFFARDPPSPFARLPLKIGTTSPIFALARLLATYQFTPILSPKSQAMIVQSLFRRIKIDLCLMLLL
jgi:hypothetical protein